MASVSDQGKFGEMPSEAPLEHRISAVSDTADSLDAALAMIDRGWTWELRRFWNYPWAVQFTFTLNSPHDEPKIKTYGMTPAEAVMEAVRQANETPPVGRGDG